MVHLPTSVPPVSLDGNPKSPHEGDIAGKLAGEVGAVSLVISDEEEEKELFEEIVEDAVKDAVEATEDAVVAGMETAEDIARTDKKHIVSAARRGTHLARGATRKGVNAAKRTVVKGKRVVVKTAVAGKVAAKKTAGAGKKAIKSSKHAVDRSVGADRATSRKEYVLTIINFFGPLIAFGTLMGLHYLFMGIREANLVVPIFSWYVFPTGDKTIAIALSSKDGYEYLMALDIAIIDTLFAWFIVYNLDLVKRWKRAGKWINRVETRSRKMLAKHYSYKKIALAFIFVFVMIPFQGSGGLSGSAIGKFMGIKNWKVVASVAAGAFVGCFLIAYTVNWLNDVLSDWVKYTLFGVFVAIVVLFFVLSFRKGGGNEDEDEEETVGGSAAGP